MLLAEAESAALPMRLDAIRQSVDEQKKQERELQEQYSALAQEHQQLYATLKQQGKVQ